MPAPVWSDAEGRYIQPGRQAMVPGGGGGYWDEQVPASGYADSGRRDLDPGSSYQSGGFDSGSGATGQGRRP
ncbi:MAG: hypothetical protein GY934_18560 [Gammaproteobacteria bacterium]|nr:hypothetical protein [Gammaproteobacteria bacterium]